MNDKGEIQDAKGYHKALYAARNADTIAQHFYEQGKTDAIKDTMAKIGAMARGLDPFTEESASTAKQTLLIAAADIEAKFELNETDPLSESSPAIWENWEDFIEKADDFSFMIEGLETTSAETLAAGLGNIGQSCGSCHKTYRIKK